MWSVLLVLGFFQSGANRTPEDELTVIQKGIVQADGPGGYYDRAYRKMEGFYWTRIPAWMQQDARDRKVSRVLDTGCGYGTLLALATETYGAQGYCMDVTRYLK